MRKELESCWYQRYPAMFEKREVAPGWYSMHYDFQCGVRGMIEMAVAFSALVPE